MQANYVFAVILLRKHPLSWFVQRGKPFLENTKKKTTNKQKTLVVCFATFI